MIYVLVFQLSEFGYVSNAYENVIALDLLGV